MASEFTFEFLKLEDLFVDNEVQRPLDERWVGKIEADFNPDHIGTVTVSDRGNGTYHVIDHQHVVEAARRAGYTELVPCKVFRGLDRAQESQMFLRINAAKPVNSVEKFPVRLQAGDPQALIIAEVMDRYGWKFSRTNGPGKVTAIASVESILNGRGKRTTLEDVFFLVTRAWGHDDPQAVNGTILRGLSKVVVRYGFTSREKFLGVRKSKAQVGLIDRPRLLERLKSTSPEALRRLANSKMQNGNLSAADAMADAIVDTYNKRLTATKRLERWNA